MYDIFLFFKKKNHIFIDFFCYLKFKNNQMEIFNLHQVIFAVPFVSFKSISYIRINVEQHSNNIGAAAAAANNTYGQLNFKRQDETDNYF